jgi:predicted dehydrogenase
MTRRVLVCGLGSIGRRHVANLMALGAEVHLWRARPELAAAASAEFGLPVHGDLDDALAQVDAVVVATEPNRHMDIALRAADAGKSLFIEKPLAASFDGVADLADLTQRRGIPVEIGCQLRFHPNLVALSRHLASDADGPVLAFRFAVGQRLDEWRPGSDYRAGFSADRNRGGGALFELIHEIDLVQWLAGSVRAVEATLAQVSDLEIAADDLANLTLSLENGSVGQVQLDMLSPVYRRSLEIVTRRAIWRWDYVTGILERQDAAGAAIVDTVPEDFERNHMFRDHMAHFLARIGDPAIPAACSLRDGIAALRVALAARRADHEGRRVELRDGF